MRKKLFIIVLLLVAVLGWGEYTNPLSLSQDEDGWTVFTPDAGARLFYISESGVESPADDYYSPAQIGGNPFEPDGNMDAPYDTYAHVIASGYVRNGYGDYILFKRGETFVAAIAERSGANSTDFAVTGAYGSSGAMPVIHPTSATTITVDFTANGGFLYNAIVGIDFYSSTRDPESGDYAGNNGAVGFKIYTNSGTIGQVLIEGCKFRFFQTGLLLQSDGSGTVEKIVLRRTLVIDSYNTGVHCHGLYLGAEAGTCNGFFIEENIFDHNGWYDTASGEIGPATVYNHNLYVVDVTNATFKHNIITRGSESGIKLDSSNTEMTTDVSIDDNLLISEPIGLLVGANWDSYGTKLRLLNINITNNVATNLDRDNPTEQGIAWGIRMCSVDTGEISANLIMNFDNSSVNDTTYINFQAMLDDVTVEDNIFYALNPHGYNDGSYAFTIEYEDAKSGNVIQNNYLQESSNTIRFFYFEEADEVTDFSYSGNEYYDWDDSVFARLEGSNKTFAQWVTAGSDTSTITQHGFSDPTKSIEEYMTSLGQTATIAAFFTNCRAQDRYSWNTDYTAEVVNDWIRVGFFGNGTTTTTTTTTTTAAPPGDTKLVMVLISQIFLGIFISALIMGVLIEGYLIHRLYRIIENHERRIAFFENGETLEAWYELHKYLR